MNIRHSIAAVACAVAAAGVVLAAQFDPDRVIPGGGMHVQGWTGKIDASSARQGRQLNDAKLVQEGNALRVTTGPATTLWNPANTASGDYTIKATFTEPKFMELNSHPHSYGIFIGGNNMGTDMMSLVYCAAYGDGNAFVRGFGPAVFNMQRSQPFPRSTRPPAWDSRSRKRSHGPSRAARPSARLTAPSSRVTRRISS